MTGNLKENTEHETPLGQISQILVGNVRLDILLISSLSKAILLKMALKIILYRVLLFFYYFCYLLYLLF